APAAAALGAASVIASAAAALATASARAVASAASVAVASAAVVRGGVWGLLFGAAFFFIPGIGPVVLAGPLVASLVGALEGAVVVGGLTPLGAVLASLGIPRNSVV